MTDRLRWRCWVCNGGGTTLGTDCSCCGAERYDDNPCPRCGRTGEVSEVEFREHWGEHADRVHASHLGVAEKGQDQ